LIKILILSSFEKNTLTKMQRKFISTIRYDRRV